MTVSNSTLHVTFLLLRAFDTRRSYNKHLADFYFQRTEYNHMTVATTNCKIYYSTSNKRVLFIYKLKKCFEEFNVAELLKLSEFPKQYYQICPHNKFK